MSLSGEKEKPSGYTNRLTSLIKREDDLYEISENIEKYLGTIGISNDEKLRKALILLKEKVELPEEGFQDESQKKEFIESFIRLVEKYYHTLILLFNNAQKGYKPMIKLLQIFELMLEHFNKEETQREKLVNCLASLLKRKEYKICDWKFIRKLTDISESFKIGDINIKELDKDFHYEIQKTKNILTWRSEKKAILFVEKAISALETLREQNFEVFLQSLIAGRFDKSHFNSRLPSIILGDEGGLYVLLNRIQPGSDEEGIILEGDITSDFLNDKRNTETNKVVLGKGSFGKVCLAMSLFGNTKVDVGQIVCVKKSFTIIPAKFGKIIDSAFEDFLAVQLNESIHAPKSLDMAIISNKKAKNHRKAYNFMEIVPENSADKVFKNQEYQKWEYQKPYIIDVLKTTEKLLNDRVFNSDLKPPNTLYDCHSRKTAIIDLGSSIYIDKGANIEKFDISNGGFGVSKPYSPPEIGLEEGDCIIDLRKSVSYLCGVTIAEIISNIPSGKKQQIENWELGKNTDLEGDNKCKLIDVVKQMIDKNPVKRMSIKEAIKNIENIGLNLDIFIKKAAQEQYVFKARELIEKDSSVLNLYADINSTKKKGIIELNLVENNPKRLKKQKTCKLTEEIEDFLNNNSEHVFVILGEAGSGKSLSLQLRFVEELEKWSFGKSALPVFFNMADEVDFDTAIRRINANIGSNLKLEEVNEDIHMFIDSYDEGTTSETKNVNFLQNYVDKLRNWKNKKIVISCRTDFVQTQGEDNLSYFMLNDSRDLVRARYIAPIGYGADDKTSQQVGYELILNWLTRENYDGNKNKKVEKIYKTIKKLGLEERMRTGLMFNMIMNMLLKNKNIRKTQQLRGFEIYNSTIKEEFNQNCKIIISSEKLKEKNQLELMKLEFKNLSINEIAENSKADCLSDDRELIWKGLEKLGELISAEMTKSARNRLRFKEVELIINKRRYSQINSDDMRMEWKTLYQICRVLGLKLEKRKTINVNDSGDAMMEETDVGFRHETYKNYYLLRGLKKVFLKNMEIGKEYIEENNSMRNLPFKEKFENINSEDEKLLSAILDDHKIMRNYELLRFFGEEVKNSKDSVLRLGLAAILKMEQAKYKKMYLSNKNSEPGSLAERNELPHSSKRAAIAICLLIAGDYSFSGEDLSWLDLSHANMRGGIFCNAKFEKTILTQAILRHANVAEASFLGADLTGLDVGIWPDLVDHKQAVNSLCFSPNGSYIASASRDKSVKIWDSLTGELLRTISGHKGEVNCVCFSPDGATLASCSDDKYVKLWDFLNGKLTNQFIAHEKLIKSIDFSPKGDKLASGSDDNTVKIWNRQLDGSLQIVSTLKGHEDSVYTVCFSQNETILASGSRDKTIRIWNWQTEKCLKIFEGHKYSVYSTCFSTDGKRLASGSWDNTIKIWKIPEKDSVEDVNNCLLTLEGHRNRVYCVKFSPDGKRLTSSSWDNTVKIWDSKSGECVQTLIGHYKPVLSVQFSPDGQRICSGGDDGIIKLWDNESGECVQGLKGHKDSVYSICFSKDGKQIASGSRDTTLKLWDSSTGECLQSFEGHKYSVYSVSFSPDAGKIISGSDDNTVRIWDSATGKCLHILKNHSDKVTSVCFSSDGITIASGSFDATVKIWDSQRGRLLFDFKEANQINSISLNPRGDRFAFADRHNEPIIHNTYQFSLPHTKVANSICFSNDGKKIASGSWKNNVKVWDCETGACLLKLIGHENRVTSVCFSPDDKTLASSSWDRTVKIWDCSSGRCLLTLKGHKKWVNSVCYHPNGKKIASGSNDNLVIIWDSQNGDRVTTLRGHKESVLTLHFNLDPNLNFLASAGEDNSAKIWETEEGRCLTTLVGHKGLINCVRFNHKGKKIATASSDNTVKIWDSSTGSCLKTLEGHSDCVNNLSFDPYQKIIASCGEDKKIKFWNISTGKCFTTIEKHINTVLSVDYQPRNQRQDKLVERKLEGKIQEEHYKFASASSDNTVKIWNIKTVDIGRKAGDDFISSFKIINEFIYSVSFCPNGDKFATSSSWDNCVRVWTKKFEYENTNNKTRDIEGYVVKVLCEEHKDRISAVCFSPDGEKLASSSWDHTIKLWKIDKGYSILTFKGHTKRVYCVNFSPDGKKIASGSEDKLIYIWESSSGERLIILDGHKGSIYGVVFNLFDNTIASCSGDKTIKIWDFLSGKCLKSFLGHTALVRCVCFCPEGKKLVSASYDKTIKIWNADGLCLYNLQDHANKVSSVSISPDGLTLISASHDTTIKVWDFTDGSLIETIKGEDKIYSVSFNSEGNKIGLATNTKENKKYIIWEYQFPDFCVAFSPDEKIVATGSFDNKVKIWNTFNYECLKFLTGHKNRVFSLSFSHDGSKLASASWDKTIKMWDATNGRCLMTLEGHENQVFCVRFNNQSNLLASGSRDKTVIIWDCENGRIRNKLIGHVKTIYAIAFCPVSDSNVICSGSEDHTLKIWDSMTGLCLMTLEEHKDIIYSVCFSPNGKTIASASRDKTVKLWKRKSGLCINTLREHSSYVYSVLFSQDGRVLASASNDKTVKLWDIYYIKMANKGIKVKARKDKSTKQISDIFSEMTLKDHEEPVFSISFGKKFGRLLSRSRDKTMRIWELSIEKCYCARTIEDHKATSHCICFSRDGKRIATGWGDSDIKIWDSETLRCISKLKGHNRLVSRLRFHPTRDELISASWDSTIKKWNPSTGDCILNLEGHLKKIFFVNYSPDGKRIVSGGEDKEFHIWGNEKGECLNLLKGHKDDIFDACFSPDGSLVASCSKDMTVILWNSFSGESLKYFSDNNSPINWINFSKDGNTLIHGSEDGEIKICLITDGTCIESLKNRNDKKKRIVNSLTFNPEENKVFTTALGYNKVILWDLFTENFEEHAIDNINSLYCVSFSPDGKKLACCGESEAISVLDFTNKVNEEDDSTMSIAFSLDGRWLASSSILNNEIKIWDRETDESVISLVGHRSWVLALCFSLDGESLVSASSDYTVKIWRVLSQECTSTLIGHKKAVNSIDINPDGSKVVSGSDDNTVKIWETYKGECKFTFTNHKDSVISVCFSQDGKKVASGSKDGEVSIWDSIIGECLKTINFKENKQFNCMSFGPNGLDGGKIVYGIDKSVGIWDYTNDEDWQEHNEHNEKVVCVSFSPDGSKVVSGSFDKKIKIWDSKDGTCLQTLDVNSSINSVCFSPEGDCLSCGCKKKKKPKLFSLNEFALDNKNIVFNVCLSPSGDKVASGSWDSKIKIWDAYKGSLIKTLRGHKNHAYSICYSRNGRKLASGSWDKTIKIWDIDSEECLMTLEGHKNKIYCICSHPKLDILASGSSDNSAMLWDWNSGKHLRTLSGHTNSVSCIHFSPKNNLICTGSKDASIKIWDFEFGICMKTFNQHYDWIFSVCFSPDGQKIVSSGKDKNVKIWNSIDGVLIRSLKNPSGNCVYSVAFANDGEKVVGACQDKKIRVWKTLNGECEFKLSGHEDSVTCLSIYNASCYSFVRLVSGSNNKTIKIWNLSKKKCLLTLKGVSYSTYSICYSPDGEKLAGGCWDNTVKIWTCKFQYCLMNLVGHNDKISDLCFSPDGRKLVSASWDKTIKIWKLFPGKKGYNNNRTFSQNEGVEEIITLEGHRDQVYSVCFCSDGSRIASCSEDGTIRIWTSDGKFLRELTLVKNKTTPFYCVSFSHDKESEMLVSGSLDLAFVWNSLNGNLLWTLAGHLQTINSACFSQDDKLIVTGSDDTTLKFWRTIDGHCIYTISDQKEAIKTVCFSPDGKTIASASKNFIIKLWKVSNKNCEATFRNCEGYKINFSPDGKKLACNGTKTEYYKIINVEASSIEQDDAVKGVSFSPDGKKVAIGSGKNVLEIWDCTDKNYNCMMRLEGHNSSIYSISYSLDGLRLASSSGDNTVRVWDMQYGNCIYTLEGHTGKVYSVNFSRDGKKLVTGSEDCLIKLWDNASASCLQSLVGHEDTVFSVCFNQSGTKVASGSGDKTIKVWSCSNGECLITFAEHQRPVNCVSFSPVSNLIVSGSDDYTVRIWNSESGECFHILKEHKNKVKSVGFSPDGKIIASCSFDNSLKIWNSQTGKCLETESTLSIVYSACFSPDGKKIAYTTPGDLMSIWSPGYLEGSLTCICFSPDGEKFATGSSDNRITIWDSNIEKPLKNLRGHKNLVNSVCFSPNGENVASGSDDKTIMIWGVVEAGCLQTLYGHKDSITCVCYSPVVSANYYLRIASGSLDKTVKIWETMNGKFILKMNLKAFEESSFIYRKTSFKNCELEAKNNSSSSLEAIIKQHSLQEKGKKA